MCAGLLSGNTCKRFEFRNMGASLAGVWICVRLAFLLGKELLPCEDNLARIPGVPLVRCAHGIVVSASSVHLIDLRVVQHRSWRFPAASSHDDFRTRAAL